jgi:hypothetical protein
MACDHVRAVLFQVNGTPDRATINMQAGGSTTPTPGNCAVTMRKLIPYPEHTVTALNGPWSCTNGQTEKLPKEGAMYTFGPGSMIGEHTFEHWYIGRKTNTTDGLSLFRRRMGNDASGNVKLLDAEEIAQDVTDMQITYLPGMLYTGYPSSSDYVSSSAFANLDMFTFRTVIAVRIVLTLTSQEKAGLAASAASAATYTLPVNVAIRAHMPGVVRR